MGDLELFDRIVTLIYGAALRPEAWPAALQAVAESLGCDLFHAFVWNVPEQRPELGWATDSPQTAEMHAQYNGYFGRIDPRRAISDVEIAGHVFRCHDHIDDRAVASSEFYQDFLLPHGLRYMIGSTLTRSPQQELKIALLRAHGRLPFTEDETDWARRLIPHLQRASALLLSQGHVADIVRANEQALERLDSDIALLDEHGTVLHLNAAARSLVGPASSLRLASRRLSAHDPSSAGALDAAWQRLRASNHPQHVLVSGPSRIAVTLCPAPAAEIAGPTGAGGMRYWVFITPLARKQVPAATKLAALFGLTPAEARLARSLVAGRTLDEAARDGGVKASTVRSQLLSVLAKTGTQRQQDLVALLVRLPADER